MNAGIYGQSFAKPSELFALHAMSGMELILELVGFITSVSLLAASFLRISHQVQKAIIDPIVGLCHVTIDVATPFALYPLHIVLVNQSMPSQISRFERKA